MIVLVDSADDTDDRGSRKRDTPCPAIRKQRQGAEKHSDLFYPPKRRATSDSVFHLQESNMLCDTVPLGYESSRGNR